MIDPISNALSIVAPAPTERSVVVVVLVTPRLLRVAIPVMLRFLASISSRLISPVTLRSPPTVKLPPTN